VSGIVNNISELPAAPSADQIDSGSTRVGKVAQLVLVCESPATSRILLQLIDRCLLTILASQPSPHSSYAKLALYLEEDDGSRSPVGLERVVVPGGGAAELAWSLLWSTVRSTIHDLIKLGFSDKSIPDVVTAVGSDESNERSRDSLLETASIIAHSLCDNVLARFDVALESEVQGAILKLYDVADVCLLLSTAYTEPPKQLLRNAFCRTSSILRDPASTYASGSSDFRSERMMLQWKELMMRSSTSTLRGRYASRGDGDSSSKEGGDDAIGVDSRDDLRAKTLAKSLVPLTGHVCGCSTGLIWAEDNGYVQDRNLSRHLVFLCI